MNLKNFLKNNNQIFRLNYTLDKKFAIVFNEDKIFLFKSLNSIFNKKNYILEFSLTEKNKFIKWKLVNKKILSENSGTDLLYLTSKIIH